MFSFLLCLDGQMLPVFSFLLLCQICLIDVVLRLLSSVCSLAYLSTQPMCFGLLVYVFPSMKLITYQKKKNVVLIAVQVCKVLNQALNVDQTKET